jgi:hypothetical protein
MGRLRRVHKSPRPGRLHNRSQLGLAHMPWTEALLHTAERIAALLHLSPPTVAARMHQVPALHKQGLGLVATDRR